MLLFLILFVQASEPVEPYFAATAVLLEKQGELSQYSHPD